jgi:hypothetical protein
MSRNCLIRSVNEFLSIVLFYAFCLGESKPVKKIRLLLMLLHNKGGTVDLAMLPGGESDELG